MLLQNILLFCIQAIAVLADDYFRKDDMNNGYIFIPSMMQEVIEYLEDCLAVCGEKSLCNMISYDQTRKMCRGYENITQSTLFISVPGTILWTNDRVKTERQAFPGGTYVEDPTRSGVVFSPTGSQTYLKFLDDCVTMCHSKPSSCHYLTFMESSAECRAFQGVPAFNLSRPTTEVWQRAQLGRDITSSESFYLVVKKNLHRSAAHAYCQQDGINGHLLKINNANEQAFLNTNGAFDGSTTSGLWMDAMQNGGTWQWSIGRPEFRYFNYASNEPATSNTCLTMDKATGTWKSADCASTMHFVCEMDKVIW